MPTVDRRPRRTVSLVVLAIGTFAIGTDGHIVIGLLDRIAADFQVSYSQSGQLVSVFALCYALFAPVCGWLFGGYDRKKSIQIASSAFILGNALCYLAKSYDVMVLGRVIAAFGAGMFTPLAFTLATDLVDDARRGMALSIVFGGMTVAMVLGVPLGSYLGRIADWHLVFLIIAIIGIVNLLLLSVLLPALPPGRQTTLRDRLAPVQDRTVLLTLSITFVAVLSEFTLYTYISVVLDGIELFSRPILPVFLFTFGAGALIGNVLVGIATDRLGSRRTLLAALALQTLLVPTIFLVRAWPQIVVPAGFAWGIVSYMYLVPIQHKLLEPSKSAGQMTMALNSSAIYLGIACGGALGGIALATAGVTSLPILSVILGVFVLSVIWRRF
jgi:predicted MFS family arabinose efflux permease